MVKKNCLTCNKEFFTYPYNIKEGKGKYCCKECYAKSLVKNKVFIRCKNCKNIFSTCPSQKKYNRKFCTFKCFNDYVKTKHPWNYHGSKKVKCANPKCTKTFTALNSKIKKGEHKYCSMQCQWDTRTLFNGEKSSTWRGGISFEPYSRDFNNSLKFMIRERFNFQCVECGIKENGKKHHIHHIDYNKKKID